MHVEVTKESLKAVRNPALRSYAERYLEIEAGFMAAVAATGLGFAAADTRAEAGARRKALQARGAVLRNNDYSVCVNRISPACEACRLGIGSATFYLSLQCHRKCFYCFNPNQEQEQRDAFAALAQMTGLSHVALTGGEPLLHPDDTVAFLQAARTRFPDAHTRLYTAGDHLSPAILARLREAGLDEIRISVRAIDPEQARRFTYQQIALAKEYIPCVMVETPVLPGTLEIMKEMLRELERLQIFGINLLEFCYPLTNAEAYRERGYAVKNPAYRTLYDYWYAGGLPVAGSELECLELLAFMLDEGMQMGGHYCSLENKHTGQIFQQHCGQEVPPTACVSERDCFYKTVKVFGDDVARVRRALDKAGPVPYSINRDYRYIEFHPSGIEALKQMKVEVLVCTQVLEYRADGPVIRELKVELATPQSFDPGADL